MLYESALELIGRTPMVHLRNLGEHGEIYGKAEGFNLSGSVKDRIALGIILDAEKKGMLRRGSTIIEPTSGNTGIGLCAVAAARGYRCIIVMPDSMSMERRKLVTAYGAQLVLTAGAEGMTVNFPDKLTKYIAEKTKER